MKADTNEMVPEEGTSILQLERPLLPIDKYAAREGLTRAIVEECGRLGIVQLRKYKGKTYVVDVPLSPYHPACEGAPILQEIHNIATQARLTLAFAGASLPLRRDPAGREPKQGPCRQANQKSAGGGQTISKTTPAPKIFGSAQTETAVAHKIAGQPVISNIEPPKAETMSALAKSMFCKAFEIKKQLIGKIKNQKIDDLRLPIADLKSKIEN